MSGETRIVQISMCTSSSFRSSISSSRSITTASAGAAPGESDRSVAACTECTKGAQNGAEPGCVSRLVVETPLRRIAFWRVQESVFKETHARAASLMMLLLFDETVHAGDAHIGTVTPVADEPRRCLCTTLTIATTSCETCIARQIRTAVQALTRVAETLSMRLIACATDIPVVHVCRPSLSLRPPRCPLTRVAALQAALRLHTLLQQPTAAMLTPWKRTYLGSSFTHKTIPY